MKKGAIIKFSFWRFNIFESSLVISIVTLTILEALLSGKATWLAYISAIAGVLSVVLSAKGHIACYLFGLIQVSLFVFISLESKFYADVLLYGLYFLPMQFIGFFSWRKKLDNHDLVKAKNMNNQQRFLWIFITAITSLLCGTFLEYIDGSAPYWDALSAILQVIAMVLMVQAYVEQWFIWIMVNVVNLIKWTIALSHNEANSIVMIIMWSLFLVNSVYGYLNWRKLSRDSEREPAALKIKRSIEEGEV